MEIRELGNSGMRVPVVGMGTWRTFDVRGARAEAHARAVVDAALAAGARSTACAASVDPSEMPPA